MTSKEKTDFKKMLPIVQNVALKAGAFVRSRLGKIQKVGFKQGHLSNVVTDVDKKSEKIIVKELRKAFPEYGVLGEEFGSINPDAKFKWVIDPIDGTVNFSHGFPIFCVSIGLEYNKKPVLGVVYDPTRDEIFYAAKGSGAFLNKKRIHVSSVSKLPQALLSTGFAFDLKKDKRIVSSFLEFLKHAQAIRRAGSAAIDLCYVACGRFDGFWEYALSPWDTAAGTLIVQEAGGRITKCDGSKYSHYDGEIVASNGKIHGAMLKVWEK